jgi:hypothetical protein
MAELQNIAEPPKIRVVVRKRPLTSREGQAQDIVDVEGVGGLIIKEIKYASVHLLVYLQLLGLP